MKPSPESRCAVFASIVVALAAVRGAACLAPDEPRPIPADEPTTGEKRVLVLEYLAAKTGRVAASVDLPKVGAEATCVYQYKAAAKAKDAVALYTLLQAHLKTAETRLNDKSLEVQLRGWEIGKVAGKCAAEDLKDRWLTVAVAEAFVLPALTGPDPEDDKESHRRQRDARDDALSLFRAAKDHSRSIRLSRRIFEAEGSAGAQRILADTLEEAEHLDEALREVRILSRGEERRRYAGWIEKIEAKLAKDSSVALVFPWRSPAADNANFWSLRLPNVPSAIAILQKSDDPRKLEQACLALARADDPKALPRLEEFLNDSALWLRLDDPDQIRNGDGMFRLGRILEAVARKGGTAADDLLVKLSQNKNLMAKSNFVYLFIDALGCLQRPSKKIFNYLESNQSNRHSPYVAISLLRIGTPEALEVLEKRLRADVKPRGAGWLCYYCIPPVRTQPNVVAFYGRLLRKDVGDDGFRDDIIQSLFDYRPTKWYGVELYPKPQPPTWWSASVDTLRELLTLADLSLELKIEDDTKAAIRKARGEIEAVLAAKTEKK